MNARVLLLLASTVCCVIVAFGDATHFGINLAWLAAAFFVASFLDGGS